ncbi:MAG: hypothetical protein P0S93_01010 [Candidatus Neptunochlamydia sp.]|nr:hypothetical protein [Candidatus Neptunochlamydia sp.]
MSTPLSFNAACRQLANAGYEVVSAAWRAPFTGGKIRMVAVGLPVLFVAAATGGVIYAVMITILRTACNKFRNGASHIYKKFFESRTITPIYPKDPQDQEGVQRRQVEIPLNQLSEMSESEHCDSVGETQKLAFAAPLPKSAAKERNEALLKFLDLVSKYFIDPWVIKNEKLLKKAAQTKDPFLQAMVEDKEALRNWLRSIALWQLSLQWDQLEAKYVKMETSSPPTLKSLQRQVQAAQLEENLCLDLIKQLQSNDDGRVTHFQQIVTASNLPRDKQMVLMAISLQFDVLLRPKSSDDSAQPPPNEKIRTNFAMIMHHGMAISMTQISMMIEGWIAVIKQMSSHSLHLNLQEDRQKPKRAPENPDLNTKKINTEIKELVKEASTTLSKELSQHYLLPLWKKQQNEWEHSIREALGKEAVESNSPAHKLANKFMNDFKTSETEFLLNKYSHDFSSALISNTAFFRSVRIMQTKESALLKTIATLPESLLLQIEPVLTGMLHKSARMMSEINLKTTVPRIATYAIDLLGCCRAMQEVRAQQALQEDYRFEVIVDPKHNEQHEVTQLLLSALTEEEQVKAVQKLYLEIPEPILTGQAVIDKLGSKAHKIVRLSQPDIQERTWIHTTKKRLEGLLRIKAVQYTQEPKGQWLATLLKSKSNGGDGRTSLIGSLLSLQNKLWKLFPGADSIAKILIMGVQTFIEEEACERVQKQLNKLTSTEFLSATIGKTLVKGLIDQSKDQKNQEGNLSLLQDAYAFLLPEEQQSILKHLGTQPQDQQGKELQKLLKNSSNRNNLILKMQREEETLAQAIETITKAYKVLKKNQTRNHEKIASLQKVYGKIKREKDLKQFARIKKLVVHVAGVKLKKTLNFRSGPSLKSIILSVIHEVYTLLSYQEVVKHWIFTIVDLLLDELEEGTSSRRTRQIDPLLESNTGENIPSMLDFILPDQRKILLQQLSELMQTSSNRKGSGWWSMSAWMETGATLASNWVPKTVWGYIETAFKKDLETTPPHLTKLALQKFKTFATNPKGLANTVIQSLIENVADPCSGEERSKRINESYEQKPRK